MKHSVEWRTQDPPRIVLDKLEVEGYQIIGMTGIGQTCAWTLYKPSAKGVIQFPQGMVRN